MTEGRRYTSNASEERVFFDLRTSGIERISSHVSKLQLMS